jgi:hypothetical protein
MSKKIDEEGTQNIPEHPSTVGGQLIAPPVFQENMSYEEKRKLQEDFEELRNPHPENNLYNAEDYMVVYPEMPINDLHAINNMQSITMGCTCQ